MVQINQTSTFLLPLDLFTDQEISTEEARRHEIPKVAFLSRIFF